MFKYLQNVTNTPANAMCVAEAKMTQGMGVVKTTDITVDFPDTATANDVYFVMRGVVHTGDEMIEIPEYDVKSETINEGEHVVLIKPRVGERFFDNQIDLTTVAEGDYVVVGTDGKLTKASKGASSNLQIKDVNYKDCGKYEGVKVEVVDWKTVS